MLAIYVSAAFGAAIAIRVAMTDSDTEFFNLIRTPFFIAGIIIACTGGLYYAIFSLMMIGVAMVGMSVRTFQFRALAFFTVLSGLIVAAMVVIALGPHLSLARRSAKTRPG